MKSDVLLPYPFKFYVNYKLFWNLLSWNDVEVSNVIKDLIAEKIFDESWKYMLLEICITFLIVFYDII